jgi:osmotically-inducible protein OsmY
MDGQTNRPVEEVMTQLRKLVIGAAFLTTALYAGAASITVTEQRLVDQRIQSDVMGVLARHPGLTGQVTVEAADQVVTLSVHLMTESQIRTAGREASLVNGVRHVVNEIRPRIGHVTR